MMDALLIDDSATQRLRMRLLLEAKPGVTITDHADPEAALVEAQMRAFDLVLVDCHMPAMDGIAFIRRMRTIPHYAQVPVVMVTNDISDAVRLAALEAGATDFLDKSMQGIELTVRLRNMIRLAKAVRRLAEQAAWLDGEVEAALRHMREREEEMIFRLALAVEYRDNDTGDHTWRVARYSQIVAEGLGLAPDLCRNLYLAAPLHDVGKVGIPDSVLLKPGRLDPDEFALIKTHAAIGKRILGGSASELIRLAAEIAEAHHEKWDGSGYPQGLAGTAIPLAARIVAVADVFDALTTLRPYKEAMSFEAALACIRTESGRHFDPACVEAFCARWADIRVAGGQERTAIRPVTEPWARVPTLLREIAAEPPSPCGWLVQEPHAQVGWENGPVNHMPAPSLVPEPPESPVEPRHGRTMDDAAGDRAGAPHLAGSCTTPGGHDRLPESLSQRRHRLPHLTAARTDDARLREA
ncbi:HD domain-containing phosphohydrolase [Methylobacterium sp. PvR107]|uniref:HD domain-containing phosphohydrolase n=1 Tax=Methylobacterium sp. PvR107 TaxID=2806597 RepID=UPI001B5E7070|nr:HD domain-containing phosphohydrolase [Methylobacterium sp. PvR107]MBP1183909.1 putative two-component system response regulator [Methylobacterium sp. PvR107]